MKTPTKHASNIVWWPEGDSADLVVTSIALHVVLAALALILVFHLLSEGG